MIKVALHEVKFFAYHGFYPEEQILGNQFLVDAEVGFRSESIGDDEIANTVNYEKLHSILADEMKKPRKLLETLVQEMIVKIRSEFRFLETVKVGIKKLNPPLPGEVKYSLVEITWIKEV
ncbi:dihydroneopterin aldolase [Mucilaginibacter arboris]|uniref:7,8-dihydroneopterin aldolase n=1 Tax=Mucilaginibacter arboris TaxID=2682090 RepID=A0A7K1T0L1_9SPHI|nr:dihydroneopterin aldolase [Mucilaginibacter arboris]MVN23112.1 dihydroneopterin aldolase [Mucilaginibacter arboris]